MGLRGLGIDPGRLAGWLHEREKRIRMNNTFPIDAQPLRAEGWVLGPGVVVRMSSTQGSPRLTSDPLRTGVGARPGGGGIAS